MRNRHLEGKTVDTEADIWACRVHREDVTGLVFCILAARNSDLRLPFALVKCHDLEWSHTKGLAAPAT